MKTIALVIAAAVLATPAVAAPRLSETASATALDAGVVLSGASVFEAKRERQNTRKGRAERPGTRNTDRDRP